MWKLFQRVFRPRKGTHTQANLCAGLSPPIFTEEYYEIESEDSWIVVGKESLVRSLPLADEVQYQTARGPDVAEGFATEVKTKDLGANDIVIAITGLTGAGKSTFIRAASGHNTQAIGHSLTSFTNQVLALRFWDQEHGRNIVLVDTPGFDATFSPNSDRAILEMISSWLKSSYDSKKRLSALLYIHRITDNRMAFAPMRNVGAFRKLCGDNALAKVYLVTTMWDEVDPEDGKRKLDELRKNYWGSMAAQGALIARCRSDNDSPEKFLRQILTLEETSTTQSHTKARKGP